MKRLYGGTDLARKGAMRIALVLLFIVAQLASAHDANGDDPCQKALLSGSALRLHGESFEDLEIGRSFYIDPKFRSVPMRAAVRDQCSSDTCWIHSELAFLENESAPIRFSAEQVLWNHLRQATIDSVLDEKDAAHPVNVNPGGEAERFKALAQYYGLIPEEAWEPSPVVEDKRIFDRLTLDLAWLSRILRDEMDQKKILEKTAVQRIDQLLTHYFGSAPPPRFKYMEREYTPVEFAHEFGVVNGKLSWGSEVVFHFPTIYPDLKDMRRHQTAVALQLRQTQRPVRAGLRYLRCFERASTGLLSIRKFSQVGLNPLWVNRLTPECGVSTEMHAILITGYAIVDGEFYFEFQNSWGSHWGRNGKGTIDPSYWPMVVDAILFSRFTDPLK